MRLIRAMEATGPMVETIAAAGVGLAFFYVYATNLTAGQFFGLISGIFLLYDPIKTLSKLHIVMQRSVQSTTEVFRILDSPPSVEDAPNAIDLPASKGGLEFQHVTFRYATGGSEAIKDLDLKIEPGKSYALVGASGAGKSTILSLILRLYDPTSGTIRIDGHDLRTLTQKSLREQIGLVTQDTFLFHDTIFNNIKFGRLDATPGRSLCRGADRVCARLHPGATARLRNRRGRQGLFAFRRATAAAGHCSCLAQERAHSSSRRSDLGARFRIGKANSARASACRRAGQ